MWINHAIFAMGMGEAAETCRALVMVEKRDDKMEANAKGMGRNAVERLSEWEYAGGQSLLCFPVEDS
jgi:hypothetical protein